MRWFLAGFTGCVSGGGELPSQAPVQVQLVIHADPLIRSPATECVSPDLRQCGSLQGPAFVRRTNNLVWLAEEWHHNERTIDVQMGPEIALAWAAEPDVIADLAEEIGFDEAKSTADLGFAYLSALLDGGRGTVGVHGHDQVQDSNGLWGDVPLPESGHPCFGVEEEPLAEWVVHNQVQGVSVLAEQLGHDLLSFSSHVPRTNAGKILALTDPDALNPNIERIFPDRFRPKSLGSGLSSCLSAVADHPPFEAFPVSGSAPLLAGTGPMVVPAVRVVGSMAPHFGLERDGSLAAAHRRLIQLLVNWRYAAIKGDNSRPWMFTFTAHLFDLQGGKPNPFLPEERQSNAMVGQSFRADVEGLSALVDQLSQESIWNGVSSTGRGVTEWRSTDQLSMDGSQFSFGEEDDPVPSELDEEFPYLPLVSTVLSQSHHLCEMTVGPAQVYGFERCEAGWVWGAPGYGCADKSEPQWVGLILPTTDGCIEMNTEGLQVGPIDGSTLGPPVSCGEGLWVPQVGVLVEATRDAVLPGLCTLG